MDTLNRCTSRFRRICQYYLEGRCIFGPWCRNIHDETDEVITAEEPYTESDISRNEANTSNLSTSSTEIVSSASEVGNICQYYLEGRCSFGSRCRNLHSGDTYLVCPIGDEDQSYEGCICCHSENSAEQIDIPKFKDKTCGICLEVVVEKQLSQREFGILPNCNHCFCFCCIKTWRKLEQFDIRVRHGCPECRTNSNFVMSSKYWVENKKEKEKFTEEYKLKLSQINCKYFRQGQGECLLGNTCMYLHDLPNGQKIDVGPPRLATLETELVLDREQLNQILDYVEFLQDNGIQVPEEYIESFLWLFLWSIRF